MEKLLAVALGGAMGSLLRVYVSEWINNRWSSLYPVGTIVVNILGAFLIGFCITFISGRPHLPQWLKFLVVAGGLGGFTTFSTYIYEMLQLFIQGDYGATLYYGGIQLVIGCLACALGIMLGRLV